MGKDYSENILVQESTGKVLEEKLGWKVIFAYNQEILGENGTLGRKNYSEVLLLRHLKQALLRINPWIDDNAVKKIEETLLSLPSTLSLMQINETIYGYIKDGIDIEYFNPATNRNEIRKAFVIDWNDINNNEFLAVKEMKIHGKIYNCRTDIVGFVNGIPLLFMEFKRQDVDVAYAYDNNYKHYHDAIPQLFYYNAFMILSNGLDARIGTLESKYEFFHQWKRLKENEEGKVDLETMLLGVCNKETFLDLLENFILFDKSSGKTNKILARNHQYLGVNEALQAYKERKLLEGKLGVFWHTQGSGKSYSMVFLCSKIKRKCSGSPTFILLTDREELNKQISSTFVNCSLLPQTKTEDCIPKNAEQLYSLIPKNPSFVFTLIQKFNRENVTPLHTEFDIVVISDEAHRSQYGNFANNLNKFLPDASKIGFTGTPLMNDDEITKRTFGKYVSVYDFKRAVEDNATVPLYYENRSEKLKQLNNPQITQDILNAIDNADLDPNQQEKLEKQFAKEIHLLRAEPRLNIIAKDFVSHYSQHYGEGKAMMVCLDKVSCVMVYNKVQKYWQEEISSLEKQIKQNTSDQLQNELNDKLQWMKETEMCVVVSQQQNEEETFKKWNLNIEPHRVKMNTRELDKEFKDKQNPFRVVFVCAMWLTGFDVKCLSYLYLDKPLKAHTLMQTIARANRVDENKSNGLIIDYIGIVKQLQQALATFTVGKNSSEGNSPTQDKSVLIQRLFDSLQKTEDFLKECGFELQKLINSTDFEKLMLLQDCCNAVCKDIKTRKTFVTYAQDIIKIFKFIDYSDVDSDCLQKRDAICAVYKQLMKKRRKADNTDLMVQIHGIISEYLQTEEQKNTTQHIIDISKIDFDLLKREFSKRKHKNLIFKDLDEIIIQRLEQLLDKNNSDKRTDYYLRYQDIIEQYNLAQDKAEIERCFALLMTLADELDKEQQRYIREGFTNEEELAIYDLLFKENLSKEDIKKIKQFAPELLHKIKSEIKKLDNWTDKTETRTIVYNVIRDDIFKNLPDSYGNPLIDFENYYNNIYRYAYEHYKHIA